MADSPSQSLHDPISTLITTLKCPAIFPALQKLAPLLSQDSTVVLLHNGMGVYEQLTTMLWPDLGTRPTFVQGITSAGARSLGPFDVQLEGKGTWDFSTYPSPKPLPASHATTVDLLSSLSAHEDALVRPSFVDFAALREKQYRKLAINAIINPLTAIFNISNGRLIQSEFALLVERLAEEISDVLTSLEDERGQPQLTSNHFEPDAIHAAVLQVALDTAGNSSSMLTDVLAGRETEVDFINGYLVGLAGGEQHAPLNAFLLEKVSDLLQEGQGPGRATMKELLGEIGEDLLE